jgi:hypothetical protein
LSIDRAGDGLFVVGVAARVAHTARRRMYVFPSPMLALATSLSTLDGEQATFTESPAQEILEMARGKEGQRSGIPAVIARRYRILRELGGMGAVYEAEHINTGERVALKTLLPNIGSNEFLKRFRREARSFARVGWGAFALLVLAVSSAGCKKRMPALDRRSICELE